MPRKKQVEYTDGIAVDPNGLDEIIATADQKLSLALNETLPAQVVEQAPPAAIIKAQVDSFLEVRRYVLDRILPLMVPGTDFYEIRGKKSLGKPGAEKIASIFRFSASFTVDRDAMACLASQDNWIAFICTLNRDGVFVGEGRGAETLKESQGDPNKMLKMAQKSAFVDAVIRATGISDLFTQDLDRMEARGDLGPERKPQNAVAKAVEKRQAAAKVEVEKTIMPPDTLDDLKKTNAWNTLTLLLKNDCFEAHEIEHYVSLVEKAPTPKRLEAVIDIVQKAIVSRGGEGD